MTAIAFLSCIDDPARFARLRTVAAYLGLTLRRYASGEVDWTGRILPSCFLKHVGYWQRLGQATILAV
ncbi:MAG: transposase [Tateyamaria sp.]